MKHDNHVILTRLHLRKLQGTDLYAYWDHRNLLNGYVHGASRDHAKRKIRLLHTNVEFCR